MVCSILSGHTSHGTKLGSHFVFFQMLLSIVSKFNFPETGSFPFLASIKQSPLAYQFVQECALPHVCASKYYDLKFAFHVLLQLRPDVQITSSPKFLILSIFKVLTAGTTPSIKILLIVSELRIQSHFFYFVGFCDKKQLLIFTLSLLDLFVF